MDDINSAHANDHTTFMAQIADGPEKVMDDINSSHANDHTTFMA